MPYTVTPAHSPEVLILEPKVFGDDRGFFFERFNARDFATATGLEVPFVQDNHSRPAKGVLAPANRATTGRQRRGSADAGHGAAVLVATL